jgi:formylglycine-generating enzyme required for sulfatase activity
MDVMARLTRLLLGAMAIFTLLSLPPAVAAASGSGAPEATASSSVKKKLKKLNKKVNLLQQQLDDVSKQQGPQGSTGPQGPSGPQGPAGTAPTCQGNNPSDKMVQSGSVCIDRYEVSVWSSPTGGTQYGVNTDDYPCDDNGQDCTNIYARSVAGVPPSVAITWFQAQQALANSGKRLPTNAEWQQAVAGTPDPGGSPGSEDCNTNSGLPEDTGERTNCTSRYGANDMIGNASELVADWDEEGFSCANWPAGFGSDITCFGRADGDISTHFPGALVRGGNFSNGSNAGAFTVAAGLASGASLGAGFRGAR